MTDSNEGNEPDPTSASNAADSSAKDNADVPPVLPGEQPSGGNGSGVLSPEDLDFTESPHVAEVSDSRYVVSADHSPPTVPDRDESTAQQRSESQRSASHTRTQADSASRSRSQPSDHSQPDQTDRTDRTDQQDQQDQHDQHDQQSQHDPRSPTEPTPATPAEQPQADQRVHHSPERARSILATELEETDARLAVDIVSRFGNDTIRHRTASDDVVGTFDNLVLWYAQHVARNTPTTKTAPLLLEKSEFSPALTPARVQKAAIDHGLDESSTIGELLDSLE